MAFNFRRNMILSRLYDLRAELRDIALNKDKPDEEKKAPQQRVVKIKSAKRKKVERGVIISLCVAGIVIFLTMLVSVIIYLKIENGAFGDDWRENKFLFAFYGWLTDNNPHLPGDYIVKEEYESGFATYAIISLFLGSIGNIVLIYFLSHYLRGKPKKDLSAEFQANDNGMTLDDRVKLENAYGDILDSRDWDKLDKIIYLLETYRADSVKEALQLIDRERHII